jgi:hypothetical protein
MRLRLIWPLLLLAIAPTVSAQSMTDARRVEFTPSTDHSATDPTTGVALLTNYTLEVYVAGGAAPVSSASLGKPALDVDGMIRLDVVALLTTPLTPGVVYQSIVSAVGPGGTASTPRSNTFAFSLPCAPTISPTSSNLTTATATTGSVTVSAGTGCTLKAVSNASSWITITAGASGSGNGSVGYSVAANTGTTSRTGTLTIAGQTFTVTQATAPCTFSVSPVDHRVALWSDRRDHGDDFVELLVVDVLERGMGDDHRIAYWVGHRKVHDRSEHRNELTLGNVPCGWRRDQREPGRRNSSGTTCRTFESSDRQIG